MCSIFFKILLLNCSIMMELGDMAIQTFRHLGLNCRRLLVAGDLSIREKHTSADTWLGFLRDLSLLYSGNRPCDSGAHLLSRDPKPLSQQRGRPSMCCQVLFYLCDLQSETHQHIFTSSGRNNNQALRGSVRYSHTTDAIAIEHIASLPPKMITGG